MKRIFIEVLIFVVAIITNGCGHRTSYVKNQAMRAILIGSISKIISSYPGEIGVAVIVNNQDTIAVNDEAKYPMMSVFKLHQAIAVCKLLDRDEISLDTAITVSRDSLDPDTWSPMLKDYPEKEIKLPVKVYLRYALSQSDNNASNLLFKRIADISYTDSLIEAIIPRETFQIAYSEDEMSAYHKKAYSNYTSPLGAAMLINRIFTDTIISEEKQEFIKSTLKECATGNDRIIAPLINKENVTVAHKTGSGYKDNGILAAHNDVAYITLPNGISYSLAVFVKDFRGDEAEASRAIAEISGAVYDTLSAM